MIVSFKSIYLNTDAFKTVGGENMKVVHSLVIGVVVLSVLSISVAASASNEELNFLKQRGVNSLFVKLGNKNMNTREFVRLPLSVQKAHLENPFTRIYGDMTKGELLSKLSVLARERNERIEDIQLIPTREETTRS